MADPKPAAPVAETIAAIAPYAPATNPLTRPRQPGTNEAVESFGFLVPLGTLLAGYMARNQIIIDPQSPVEVAAVSALTVSFGSFALSRLRDLRWRGSLHNAAKAQE